MIRTNVRDPKDRMQNPTLQNGDVQRIDRIIHEQRIGRDCEFPPAIVDQETKRTCGLGDRIVGWCQFTQFVEFFKQLGDRETVHLFQDAVVCQNTKLTGRE